MQLKTNTILITGSTGFIGKSLLKSILQVKKYKIICLSNIKKIQANNKYLVVTKNKLFKTIKKINYIIHMASCDESYAKDKKEIVRKNKSLDFFIKKTVTKYKVKKLIFLSSNRVYENPVKNFITENSKTSPTSTYGKSKLQSEKTFRKLNTNLIIFRLPSVISKNFNKGLIFRLTKDLKNRKKITIYNPYSKFNNIITLSDLVKTIIESLNKFTTKKRVIINLSSDKPEKFIYVVNFLKQKLKSDSKINIFKGRRKSLYYSNTQQKNSFRKRFSTVKSALRSIF